MSNDVNSQGYALVAVGVLHRLVRLVGTTDDSAIRQSSSNSVSIAVLDVQTAVPVIDFDVVVRYCVPVTTSLFNVSVLDLLQRLMLSRVVRERERRGVRCNC